MRTAWMYFLLFQCFDNYVIYYYYICQSRIVSSVYIFHMIVTVRWTGGLSYIFATLPEIKAVKQRHQATVFCKMSVRRGKYSQEFFIPWGGLNIFRWPFHSFTIFEAYICGIFPTIFWSLILHISTPKLGYFSYKKGNLKFSDSKMWWREESKNSHFRNTLNCIWNFRENNTGFRKT